MNTTWLVRYILLGYAAMAPMFVLRRLGPLDFWWWMAANGTALTVIGLVLDSGLRREMAEDLRCRQIAKIAGGLCGAFALSLLFGVGNSVIRILWTDAVHWIARVYDLRDGASSWRIAMLLTFVIGPAEEIVWRGVVQRGLTARLGPARGLAAAVAVYSGLHLATGNPVLLLAAAVAGGAWGWMYHRWRSLTVNMVSHALWDVVMFVFVPLA